MDHLKYPENVTVHTQQTLHSLFWSHPGRLIARSDGPLFLDRRWHTRHCSGGLTPPRCSVSAPPVRAAASATAKQNKPGDGEPARGGKKCDASNIFSQRRGVGIPCTFRCPVPASSASAALPTRAYPCWLLHAQQQHLLALSSLPPSLPLCL